MSEKQKLSWPIAPRSCMMCPVTNAIKVMSRYGILTFWSCHFQPQLNILISNFRHTVKLESGSFTMKKMGNLSVSVISVKGSKIRQRLWCYSTVCVLNWENHLRKLIVQVPLKFQSIGTQGSLFALKSLLLIDVWRAQQASSVGLERSEIGLEDVCQQIQRSSFVRSAVICLNA